MQKRRPTLKDIARLTGVHVSTVSRALDPQGQKAITGEVVERVKAAALELGYRRNRIASSLRTSRTMTVGVMIPDITNVIFPPILRGIESVLEPIGYASIIVNTDNDLQREQRLLDVLRDRGVDGILHAAVLRDDPSLAEAALGGMPIVTLNRRSEESGIPYVINDEAAGIGAMLRHLKDLGHRRIAHLAGPQQLSTGHMRLDAFRRHAAALGLPTDDGLIAEASRFDEQEGARCASELLDGGVDFTAILAANDRLALGALDALAEAGLSCPGDISVSGYNDMPFLEMIRPRLTTVRIRQFDAGAAAARMLIGEIEDQPNRLSGAGFVLPVELVLRQSTGPAPAAALPKRRPAKVLGGK